MSLIESLIESLVLRISCWDRLGELSVVRSNEIIDPGQLFNEQLEKAANKVAVQKANSV